MKTPVPTGTQDLPHNGYKLVSFGEDSFLYSSGTDSLYSLSPHAAGILQKIGVADQMAASNGHSDIGLIF